MTTRNSQTIIRLFSLLVLFQSHNGASQQQDRSVCTNMCQTHPSVSDFVFSEDTAMNLNVNVSWTKSVCSIISYNVTYGCNPEKNHINTADLRSVHTNSSDTHLIVELPSFVRTTDNWECVFIIQGVAETFSGVCLTKKSTCGVIEASSFITSNETCIQRTQCPMGAASSPIFLPSSCSKTKNPISRSSISESGNIYIDESHRVCVNETALCEVGQLIEVCREYELRHLAHECGMYSRLFRTKISPQICSIPPLPSTTPPFPNTDVTETMMPLTIWIIVGVSTSTAILIIVLIIIVIIVSVIIYYRTKKKEQGN